MTNIPKHIYRTVRALVFAAILAVVALYLIIYVLVAMPAAQKRLVSIAERELSSLLMTDVKIGRLEILPFNEVRVSDVRIFEQTENEDSRSRRQCVGIGHLGAGIDLLELLRGNILITYAEITELNAKIEKKTPDSPFNIQFIIDAFKPKEKKESENVSLCIHTVVIRHLSATYDLLWIPRKKEVFDPNHIAISNFRADISIPDINTKPFGIESKVRRIAFLLDNKLDVKDLSFKLSIGPESASLKDFLLKLPESSISVSDLDVSYKNLNQLGEAISNSRHLIAVQAELIPSDLALFFPGLREIKGRWNIGMTGVVNRELISDFSIGVVCKDLGFNLLAEGELRSFLKPKYLSGYLNLTQLTVSPEISSLAKSYLPALSPDVERIVNVVGSPSLDVNGVIRRDNFSDSWKLEMSGNLATAVGSINMEGSGSYGDSSGLTVKGNIESQKIEVGELLGRSDIADAALSVEFEVNRKNTDLNGQVDLTVPYIETRTGRVENVHVEIDKTGKEFKAYAFGNSDPLKFELDGFINIDGRQSTAMLSTNIERLPSSLVGLKGKLAGTILSGNICIDVTGNEVDNIEGIVTGSNLSITPKNQKSLVIERLIVTSEIDENGHVISLDSDPVTLKASGEFSFPTVAKRLKALYASIMPAINPLSKERSLSDNLLREGNINLSMTVRPLGVWADFFNFPVTPLEDMKIEYQADFAEGTSDFYLSAPYLRQGKSKLFAYNTIEARMTAPGMVKLNLSTETPTKSSETRMELTADLTGDEANAAIVFNPDRNSAFSGSFLMGLRAVNILNPEILLNLKSSDFKINEGEWRVENGDVLYTDKKLAVNNIRISHEDQFVKINGNASANPEDKLTVELADIDLSYIFDVLNINHVNFGGLATGSVVGSELFTKTPKARTVGLRAKDFAYGGATLGDADLSGIFHADDTSVEIGAKIKDPLTGRRRAEAEGNIWIGKDSLSFNFDADRLNASFIGQFMKAFASDLTATASGNCHLFGTFKDIDLIGKLKADSIRFKLDFTGVYYGGSDSVILDPGKIILPSFRIYDRDGNSGVFSGELRHRFLRDAFFDFRLRDAERILCYDLPKGPEGFWWGTVYASGGATIHGIPGRTDIDVDVSSEGKSSFWFELSEKEAAREYNFLTFTDVTPKPEVPKKIEKPNYLEIYRKKKILEEELPGDVHIDLRLNVTPGVLVTLVMDPVSGDKITARGYGPLQLQYETENDDPRLYGKYTISEGLYNFSLQDVILKDFQIRDGSSISFNGDPLAAILDIRAAYRVNTSLTDLDKSFAYDRDLNRTNVPVDAMLLVSGPLDTPDIDFDLEFPTLTEEVGRKVRSIISTNDLMSRQIIYLLALNRFYTPEYMDTSGSGSEWTSVASSTISSQLGNALSQLTDKLSVMPSIRSDKGDFSDLEMDVALSSRLLNNRLLINGNFGYRDRTTSTTTFVGDFDVQYLLDRKGNFRLKAYNHFNDQNYYLRQALTTQGIGLEYRHDFNRFLSFLRRKRKADEIETVVMPDTITRPDSEESTMKKVPAETKSAVPETM